MKPYYLPACILLLSMGCTTIPTVTTNVTALHNSTYQPKPLDCEIQLLTQMPADRKYEELAILDAITDTGIFTHKDLNSMLPSLKAKACELGADAIVIKNVEPGGTPVGNGSSTTPSKAYGVAIKFVAAN